jgi:hypothetical protein
MSELLVRSYAIVDGWNLGEECPLTTPRVDVCYAKATCWQRSKKIIICLYRLSNLGRQIKGSPVRFYTSNSPKQSQTNLWILENKRRNYLYNVVVLLIMVIDVGVLLMIRLRRDQGVGDALDSLPQRGWSIWDR